MIYVITIASILLPFVCLYIKRRFSGSDKPITNRILSFILDEKTIEVIVNLLVTVASVTLALLLTSFDSAKKDANKTVELLSSLDRELKMVQDNIEKYYVPVCTRLDISEDEQESVEYYKAVPVVDVLTLESVLSNELVVTNMNQHSYAAMIDIRRAIIASFDRLDAVSTDDELIWELSVLEGDVALMRDVITMEISFQKGDIPSSQMKETINGLYEKSWGKPSS